MSVHLLDANGKFTGECLSAYEAAQYIRCLERRVKDLEEQAQRYGVLSKIDEWRRADQNCLCVCGRKYVEHPYGGDILPDRTMILHRLCDGSLVKL